MMKKDRSSGITLVALVVTVVVLLILAGVALNLVLGNNGILNKAKDASQKHKQASENEQKELSTGEDEIDKALGQYDPLKKLPSKTIGEAQSDYMTENTKVTLTDGTVVVPEGFKISTETASTVQGGVVIEDKDRNQFVWIPVDDIADYKRTAYSSNVATETIDAETNSVQIKYDSSNDYYFTEAMPEDERLSVETYYGYYIGRYEAGDKESTEATTPTMRTSSSSTANTVTIKKEQAPYNWVTKTQAQSLAEGMDTKQGYKATTKLCSSYAWDTAIEFMQKTNSDYGRRSVEGNYEDVPDFTYKDIEGASQTKTYGSYALIPTGQTTPVCNIYDMGGNCWEWTTERYSYTSFPCTRRGGSYNSSYTSSPAGYRFNFSGVAYDYVGFRVTLFM